MSLINYVEPVSIGGIFVGVGSLILTCVVAVVVYRVYIKFAQWFDVLVNRESKHALLEEAFLDRLAKEKGIDLNKELIKRQMLEDTSKKSFRRKVEDQMYEEMFGSKEEVKKK